MCNLGIFSLAYNILLQCEWTLFCRASGHVDRFSDLMVKDVKTGECFRADQLLADHLEQLLADQKCPADKKEEYNAVLRQVCVCVHVYVHTFFMYIAVQLYQFFLAWLYVYMVLHSHCVCLIDISLSTSVCAIG